MPVDRPALSSCHRSRINMTKPALFLLLLLVLLARRVESLSLPRVASTTTERAGGLQTTTTTTTTTTRRRARAADATTATAAAGRAGSEKSGRRGFLRAALVPPIASSSLLVVAAAAGAPGPARSAPPPAAGDARPPPLVPPRAVARRLRAVPTFAIVDGDGVPFHTYDKDSAGGYGYFFASYKSAEYVLQDAREAFAKAKAGEGAGGGGGDNVVPDAWGRARVATVPLDAVMQLTVRRAKSVARNGGGREFDAYYQVIPSQEDQNAALRIEDGPRYRERGRVPLFYVDGLTLAAPPDDGPSPEGGSATVNPVYFRVRDLRDEWERQHPDGTPLPAVRVRELNETFRAMIRPGGKDDAGGLLRNTVFVPSPESVERAEEVARGGGAYRLGEMILTK